jgi:protease-4
MINKIGVTVDTLSTNASSQDLNFFIPFSQKQKDKLYQIMQPVYYRFVEKVAKSRKKTFEEARAVAKGRVWTGEMALQKGLVDVLGGLNDAIALVSKRIGVVNPTIKRFPKPKEDFELLLELLTKKDEEAKAFQQSGIAQVLALFPMELRNQVLQYIRIHFLAEKEHILAVFPEIIWEN